MRWQVVGIRMFFLAAVILGLFCSPSPVVAQNNNNNQNQNQNQNQNLGVAGIEVDAQGVLRKRVFFEPLSGQRIAAARAALNRDVIPFSKLRKVSLTRLEQVLRQKNGVLTDEMRSLAGLLRARYVFFYPETGDIVIAGPAEGWATDASGRVVGITSGRPVLRLEDLVVALRAFPPGKSGAEVIGCSIDPTPEGLAATQQFLRSLPSNLMVGQERLLAARVLEGLPRAQGMHQVAVHGVSPKTHFAQVLVEADYRMKLIGIGLEQPPVRMVSFIERVNPSHVARNALFRWYFVPDYQCVRMSGDGLAMELVGDGVKLIGENEMVTSSGQRGAAVPGRANIASQAFVTSFTQKYPALADRSPVYAELRNLIDVAVLAAYIQQQDYYGKANWKMELFASEKSLPLETYAAPKLVEPAVNAVMKSGRLMTPIAGGVHIEAQMAVKPENVLSDEKGNVTRLRGAAKPELAPGQWWWD